MKTREHRSRWQLGRRGISLIETLVALGLFALTAGTMSSFLVRQIRGASTNNLYTKAYSLAEDQLESTRAMKYVDMVAGSKSVASGATTFTVATQVQTDVPADGLKKIQVDVSWKEPGGSRNVSVYTIFTEVRRY